MTDPTAPPVLSPLLTMTEHDYTTKWVCSVNDPAMPIAWLRAEIDAQRATVARLKSLYEDLLYQVATKHPNETRHETAKRYIQQAENRPSHAASAAALASPDTEKP